MADNLFRLQYRLKSCLQCILDLEQDRHSSSWAYLMRQELAFLQAALQHVGCCKLQEQDVHRVEKATGFFLQELSKLQKK